MVIALKLPLWQRKFLVTLSRAVSALVCAWALSGSICFAVEDPQDDAYKRLPRRVDPESRVTRLKGDVERDRFDVSAFVGMPDAYRDAARAYVDATVRELRAEPPMRKRFVYPPLPSGQRFPCFPDHYAPPLPDGEVVVPIAILPRPDAVRAWTESTEAAEMGWRTKQSVIRRRGTVYGRRLVFEPGPASEDPYDYDSVPIGAAPCDKMGYMGKSGGYEDLTPQSVLCVPRLKRFGNVDLDVLRDFDDDLRVGKPQGARIISEMVSVPAYLLNERLRWTLVSRDSQTDAYLAYALLDGAGLPAAGRAGRRPLLCHSHQPRTLRFEDLLVPTPKAWPPTIRELTEMAAIDESVLYANEEWCLDEWFPQQPDAVWVVREAEDSKPLQESFLLMPAREKSDRPLFLIALFAETEPQQLVEELAAVHGVPAAPVLQSTEAMSRLRELYDRVKTFKWDEKP
jgi:hypothetical protein